mgnify:CR=1 FL=1
MDRNNRHGIRTPRELLLHLKELGPEMSDFAEQQTERYCPSLILNQVRSNNDIKVGHAMETACRKNLGLSVDSVSYKNLTLPTTHSLKTWVATGSCR